MLITEALPQLPAAVARQVLQTLIPLLQPPISDTPESLAARDAAAIAAVASFHPADAAEALLAVQTVAAYAHAMDSRRLAARPGLAREDVLRLRSLAATKMRVAQSVLRTLLDIQAVREQAEGEGRPVSHVSDGRGTDRADCAVPAGPQRPKLRIVH